VGERGGGGAGAGGQGAGHAVSEPKDKVSSNRKLDIDNRHSIRSKIEGCKMPDFFQVEAIIPAEPDRVFAAWMDSREHAAFTGGGEAVVESWSGGRFIAWDGYMHGIILGLEPGKRIVQTWRTSEFAPESRDSRLAVEFEQARGGTRVRIRHTDLPPDQVKRYEKGWIEHYLKPLGRYFAKGSKLVTKAAPAGATSWGRRKQRKRRAPKPVRKAARKAAHKPARKKPAARRRAPAPRKPAKKRRR